MGDVDRSLAEHVYSTLGSLAELDPDDIPYSLDEALSLRTKAPSPSRWATFNIGTGT
jgi:hypothetical protein